MKPHFWVKWNKQWSLLYEPIGLSLGRKWEFPLIGLAQDSSHPRQRSPVVPKVGVRTPLVGHDFKWVSKNLGATILEWALRLKTILTIPVQITQPLRSNLFFTQFLFYFQCFIFNYFSLSHSPPCVCVCLHVHVCLCVYMLACERD